MMPLDTCQARSPAEELHFRVGIYLHREQGKLRKSEKCVEIGNLEC